MPCDLVRSHFGQARNLLLRLRLHSEPEDVHRARVAIRRLRTILRAIAPALEPRGAALLHKDLKAIADVLGDVRDADVRAGILLPLLARIERRTDGAVPSGTAALAASLQRARRNARRRLRVRLASADTRQRLRRDARLVNGALLCPSASDAGTLLEQATRRRRRKVARALKRMPACAAQRHALRMRVKECRYLMDACAGQRGQGEGRGAPVLLEDIQDCLGELNDLAQARRWLKQRQAGKTVARALRRKLRSRRQRPLARLARLARELRRAEARKRPRA